jgi:hypothetical protein
MAAGAALVAVTGLAACNKGTPTPVSAPPTSAAPGLSVSPPAATKPAAKPTSAAAKPTAPPAAPLTCDQIKNATVGSPSKKFQGTYDGVPLADGLWNGEDGATIELKVCGVGDMDHDGSVDAMAGLEFSTGGTGHFWSIAFWHNNGGAPVYTAVLDLDDRTPVESIDISNNKAEIVYDTRGPSDPMAELTIRRTAIFTLSGTTISELTHVDEPYTP